MNIFKKNKVKTARDILSNFPPYYMCLMPIAHRYVEAKDDSGEEDVCGSYHDVVAFISPDDDNESLDAEAILKQTEWTPECGLPQFSGKAWIITDEILALALVPFWKDCAEGKYCFDGFDVNDIGSYDAIVADAVIQTAIFGTVILG